MALPAKYYSTVAQILSDNATLWVATGKPDGVTAIAEVTEDLADFFERDNPNFDRERFLKAVATA